MAQAVVFPEPAVSDLIQLLQHARRTGAVLLGGGQVEARLMYENCQALDLPSDDVSRLEIALRVVNPAAAAETGPPLTPWPSGPLVVVEERVVPRPMSAALVDELRFLLAAMDSVRYLAVLSPEGWLRGEAGDGEGTAGKQAESRETLVGLVRTHLRLELKRAFIEQEGATYAVAALPLGWTLVLEARSGATLGGVSLSLGTCLARLAASDTAVEELVRG